MVFSVTKIHKVDNFVCMLIVFLLLDVARVGRSMHCGAGPVLSATFLPAGGAACSCPRDVTPLISVVDVRRDSQLKGLLRSCSRPGAFDHLDGFSTSILAAGHW